MFPQSKIKIFESCKATDKGIYLTSSSIVQKEVLSLQQEEILEFISLYISPRAPNPLIPVARKHLNRGIFQLFHFFQLQEDIQTTVLLIYTEYTGTSAYVIYKGDQIINCYPQTDEHFFTEKTLMFVVIRINDMDISECRLNRYSLTSTKLKISFYKKIC